MTCHCFDNLLAKPYSGVPSELNAERERDFKDKKNEKNCGFMKIRVQNLKTGILLILANHKSQQTPWKGVLKLL